LYGLKIERTEGVAAKPVEVRPGILTIGHVMVSRRRAVV
jgi:hypothetical protein